MRERGVKAARADRAQLLLVVAEAAARAARLEQIDIFSGVKRVDFDTALADGRIELTDTDSYSRESWQVANVLIPTLRASEPADKVKLYQAYNAKAKPALTYGFMPDFSAVDAENAAVNAVWKTYSEALFSGTANPADTLDMVIQEMKTAGSDKIVAEIQAQLDAWLANK